MRGMDYESLGFRAGLEIHQQLDTHKLFCEDRSELSETIVAEFRRRLRPTQSELGEGDAAAVGERLGVPAILLEEDAARKVEQRDGEVVYRLDRLGIPLVEIATTPNIASPEEAAKVALRIGSLLRATRRVRRGIGTIREDVNVSIARGARTETKGVQDLRMMATYVDNEVRRQQMLADVAETLRARKASVDEAVHDVTATLAASKSKGVANALAAG